MRRRVRAGVTAGILAASLSVSGCDAIRHVLDQQAERSPSPSTTQPVTDPAQRVRQSDLETKVGAGMNARTPGGAMIVASNGTRIPNGIVEASAKAAASVRALDPQASKNALLVLVPRDDAEFKEYTGQEAASQLANTVTGGGGRLPYVVMSDWTTKNPDTLTTRETLAHEAFHALTLEKLATERPLWLLEGWAEYVGQRTVPQAPHKRRHLAPRAERRGTARSERRGRLLHGLHVRPVPARHPRTRQGDGLLLRGRAHEGTAGGPAEQALR